MACETHPLTKSLSFRSPLSYRMESLTEKSATLIVSTVLFQLVAQALSSHPLQLLPPEVLAHIFGLVRDLNGDKPMKGAICKHLLPYTRANLFSCVKLTTWKQFRVLAGAFEEHEALGELVDGLSLQIEEAIDLEAAFWQGEEPTMLIEDFLGALAQVDVVFCSTPLFTEILLTTEVADTCLPEMTSLHIEDSFKDLSNPFDMDLFGVLICYPKLDDLSLTITRSSDSITGRPRRNSFQLPNIFSLKIIAPLSNSAAAPFLGAFGEALVLILYDTSDTPKFTHILPKLSPAVKSLTLVSDADPDASSLTLIDDALSRFAELDRLRIDACGIIGPNFYQALSEPLSVLGFGYGVDVCAATLLDLLQGNSSRERLASLEELELDLVDGERGTRIEEDMNGDMYFDAGGAPGPYPDWVPPNWTPRFTKQGARELVKVADKVGVKITGSLQHAFEVEEEFMNELDWVGAWEQTCEEIAAEMGY